MVHVPEKLLFSPVTGVCTSVLVCIGACVPLQARGMVLVSGALHLTLRLVQLHTGERCSSVKCAVLVGLLIDVANRARVVRVSFLVVH